MKIVLFLSLVMMSCSQHKSNITLEVQERTVLDGIPSGSGMVVDRDHAYLISDDAPKLFTLALVSKKHTSTVINGLDSTVTRIPKLLKPDLEALCRLQIDGKNFLLAFGSGSISPLRDSLLLIRIDDPSQQQRIPLTALYKNIRGTNRVINIEGAACNTTDLFLMDREHNQLHRFSIASFIGFIKSKGTLLPENITTHTLSIPGSFTTRISGGCFLDNNTLLFCASMEDAPDAVADGKIYGSYIGLLRIDDMKILSLAPLADARGMALTDKLESVDLGEKNTDGSYQVWAIADNDTGNTVLFRLQVRFE